jgi:prepilin-type N-terminal cleavage/methylation domain-containing protein/prepilin-type processing-associated H-X9-DG protein
MWPLRCRGDLRLRRDGFTLVELLVAVAVIALLASMLLPALARAKGAARKSQCLSQLHQQGLAWQLYLDDHADRFPDRRDLKVSLPGGYKPWTGWPASDPRSGWVSVLLGRTLGDLRILQCPAVASGALARADSVWQSGPTNSPVVARANYWMWRFDRMDDPVPDDNFWGRPVSECVERLRVAGNPAAGQPDGPSAVELVVDPYFPSTILSVPAELRGWSAHLGGRNRLMLDGHVEHFRDPRTR